MVKKTRKKTSSQRQAAAEAILQAVENQLAANDPPEVRTTLNRLISQGQSRENALRHIAGALIIEIFNAATKNQAYDAARYLKNLHALPMQPQE